jgi:DNA-binding NarL/FixJ family response regulator
VPGRPLRVLLVDDHRLLSESLAAALRASGVEVDLADLSDRASLISSVCARPPDLVLLDLELGGAIGDGGTLVRPFVQAGARVLLVSASTATARVGAAIEQGAVGHVAKTAPFLELLKPAPAAAHDRPGMPAEERQRLLHELRMERAQAAAARGPFDRLTCREQQVLLALADGRNVAQIAAEWFVSESTVRSQVRGILSKLGVGSQLEAVALALKAGWLVDPDGGGSGYDGPAVPRQR